MAYQSTGARCHRGIAVPTFAAKAVPGYKESTEHKAFPNPFPPHETNVVLGLLVISIASGATVLSHVNDSGFWLVNRYFGLTEAQTLRSWTVMETIIGLVGLVMSLIIGLFI